MNGLRADGLALAAALVERAAAEPAGCDLLVCPPATLLAAASARRSPAAGVALGGQDCHAKPVGRPYRRHRGADAGRCRLHAMSSSAIPSAGTDHGESDAMVRAKAEAALAAGLIAIVCVGETAARARCRPGARGRGAAARRLAAGGRGAAASSVVAYEPVWAIGTGPHPDRRPISRRSIAIIRAELDGAGRRAGARAHPLWRLGQARRTPRRSWRCRMSTARWSAAPASRPRISGRSRAAAAAR